MYWSTPFPSFELFPIQYSTALGSKGPWSYLAEQYRKKYQELSTKVSIVSVSRRTSPPQVGHFNFVSWTKDSFRARGEPPSPVTSTSSGRMTGRSFSGTGTIPHFPQ